MMLDTLIDLETAKLPLLHTPLPGPKAQMVIDRDTHYISPSYTRGYPLVMKRGRGAMIEDVDGNLFLDFNAGVAVCATGHSHPKVVEAIKKQVDDFIHISGTDYYYPHLPALCSRRSFPNVHFDRQSHASAA